MRWFVLLLSNSFPPRPLLSGTARDAYSNPVACSPDIAANFTGTMTADTTVLNPSAIACSGTLVALTFTPTVAADAYVISASSTSGSAAARRCGRGRRNERTGVAEGGGWECGPHFTIPASDVACRAISLRTLPTSPFSPYAVVAGPIARSRCVVAWPDPAATALVAGDTLSFTLDARDVYNNWITWSAPLTSEEPPAVSGCGLRQGTPII